MLSQDKQDKQKLVERFAKVVDRCDRTEHVVIVKELVRMCEHEVETHTGVGRTLRSDQVR